ncbi:hypothetical protein F9U64_10530 [Gracilibacillus oryzae]|uniref:Uncharacterized protein n=1 Tax=Gracilibacillus oryzae TaxID=1672701 RepID=A0A7C8GTB6_9BACI|nr:hypothetical protein [Gracilibacillus oryzae]KAB8135706.1 hypothetical protein F9U64_10530 [Gracilibacillus oryzae]
MKRSSLITMALILSVLLNLVMLQQVIGEKDEAKLAHFEEIHNGLTYSLSFGETLKENYDELALDEKVEYLTAMHWSLTLSAWTLEDVEPGDRGNDNIAKLLTIYRGISSDLKEMIRKDNANNAVMNPLTIWLKDMNYLKENFDLVQLSKANDKGVNSYLRALLQELEYENESLEEFRHAIENTES